MTRKQCSACPWRKDVIADQDIPGGYSRAKHCALISTISEGASARLGATIRVFACHESPIGAEIACVGWLAHQLGPGNNIPLRIAVSDGRIDADVETVGVQHERFEDTIPKKRRPYKKPEVQSKRRGQ